MEFKDFREKLQKHFAQMTASQTALFVVDVDKDTLWNLYLDSFPPGTNEVYRQRREFDCSCCRSFVKQFGSVVTIQDNQLVTLWDFDPADSTYSPVTRALSAFIHAAAVKDALMSKESGYGTLKSLEQLPDGIIQTWHHFRLDLPRNLIVNTGKSQAELRGEYRETKNVFKRSLEEISRDAVETVLDLIAEKTLYRGEEWQAALSQFAQLQSEYHALPVAQWENYCWKKSGEIGGAVARIRNHSIGTLLQDLTAGMEVENALRRYEKVVAPTNYKRPKAVFTARMVEQAEKTVMELGLLDSLCRRHATLSDITINNVLWANRDATQHMNGAGGVFAALRQEATLDPRKFGEVPGISIADFLTSVLPTVSTLEMFMENKHEGNLFSLIAPQIKDSPSLFKWDNAFSWAYNGNLADSMKQRVKEAGGNVEGVLRFSLQWNERGENQNDFDAHCVEPNGNRIFFQNKMQHHPSSGILDVDIINPGSKVAVENITWTNPARMPEGVYQFMVHNYSHNGGRSGFTAEIEFNGQIFEYSYPHDFAVKMFVPVANVTYSRRDGFSIKHLLPTTTSTKMVWGLQTNQFQPVSTVLYSPNYWDGQGVGNRHYFFTLAGCKNESQPNGFYNEYLREAFMPHKHVFEALGNKMKVAYSENQLSGLGFSSTQRNAVICKTDARIMKIIF